MGSKKIFQILSLAILLLGAITPDVTYAERTASLYLIPSIGQFVIGDTFMVSLYINTGGQSVNAIEANLNFPPDMLQVVLPSAGKSVIGIWVGQPEYSNSEGTISFRGAIPNPGLNSSQGIVSTVTFRAKTTGRASITLDENSKVLLNDGKGTNVLGQMSGAILDLNLPPPQGPIVVSSTHPDQLRWYQSDAVIISWAGDTSVDAYSYNLDTEPVSVPDDISDPNKDGESYTNVSDGTHYFHIKAKRKGIWGGVTHFAVHVDKSPPAEFTVKVQPGPRTSQRSPLIEFQTTDRDSGVSFYEIKIIPTSIIASSTIFSQPSFLESASPYIPILEPSTYNVVIRAHDNAGNIREIASKLEITNVAGFLPESWFSLTNMWLLLLTMTFMATGLFMYRRRWG